MRDQNQKLNIEHVIDVDGMVMKCEDIIGS